VITFLGKGAFGQVVKCIELSTGEEFAVKILKNKRNYYCQGIVEVKIMLKVGFV
jgi:serine/threonine protein kinase